MAARFEPLTSIYKGAEMTEILDLRIAEHPAAPGREVKLFQDSEVAFSHMRDHLLSQPECHAWDLLDSGFGGVVDLENPSSRWRFAHEAACSDGSNSRDLFNLYCDVITRNLEEATWLNWHASVDGITVGRSYEPRPIWAIPSWCIFPSLITNWTRSLS